LIGTLYGPLLEPYWPPERRHVEAKYKSISFPFEEIEAPAFSMDLQWDLSRILGYLRSWSAVQAFRRELGHDPVAQIEEGLRKSWGPPALSRRVSWPLTLRVGRVELIGP
jgi:hypothetical protein